MTKSQPRHPLRSPIIDNAAFNPLRWLGSWQETNTSNNDQIYKLGARYYTTSGAFTQPDAIAGNISDPRTMTAYNYAGSDPVNQSDPSGYYFFDIGLDGCYVLVCGSVSVGFDGDFDLTLGGGLGVGYGGGLFFGGGYGTNEGGAYSAGCSGAAAVGGGYSFPSNRSGAPAIGVYAGFGAGGGCQILGGSYTF